MEDNKIWSKLIITCVFSLLAGAFLFAVFVFSGYSPDFMTDGQCNDMIDNASNNAANYGMEYTIATITQQAIKCEQIPINYANYSYNLIAVECLDLNENGGK